MNKIPYLLALLLTASILFTSCRNGDDDSPPGIGYPTATTDPGVLIGTIDDRPIRWATRNVNTPGTFAPYSHSTGMLFQWNRRTAWNTTDAQVENWNATPAEGNTWERTNDPCPQGWRVPTIEELTILHGVGYSDFTQQNGVNGYFLGTAPNRIFLPAPGGRCGKTGVLVSVGVTGGYWSSTKWEHDDTWARNFNFCSNSFGMGTGWRGNGSSVRCVAE